MQNDTNATGGTGDETEVFETINGVELSQVSGGYYGGYGYGPAGYTNVGSKPQYYTVKPGDNLTNIANAHDESLNRLLRMNPQFQSNPNLIYPGQRVLTGHTSPNYQPTYPCYY